MDRRRFLLTSLAGVLAGPFAVGAQPAGKVYQIGALGAFDSPGWAGFREGLRELGWEDGRNIVMEFRFAGGRPERYRELAEELVRLNVDVLAAANSQSVRAAKEATGTIPIVMFEVGHPVDAGFVASLARPGGNVTGMSSQPSELEGKSVELSRNAEPIERLYRTLEAYFFKGQPRAFVGEDVREEDHLCRGGRGPGGEGQSNGCSVNWAFMRPVLRPGHS
jgi:putative ABC transport system substrate-binding protein